MTDRELRDLQRTAVDAVKIGDWLSEIVGEDEMNVLTQGIPAETVALMILDASKTIGAFSWRIAAIVVWSTLIHNAMTRNERRH